MLNRIITLSIKHKLIVGLAMLGLIISGVYSLTKLPIDAIPDITNNQVQIITTSPALGAEDVERLISFPIEQGVANIPGIEEIRSFSRFGLSLVTVVFEDDIDIYWARQQITERLKSVQEIIPPGIGYPFLAPVSTGLSEIYQYTISPKKGYENTYSLQDLRTAQEWIVRRQLLGTKGVADVSSFGGDLKQYEIAINPQQLASMGVTISEIFKALETNNANAGGAYIERKENAYFIRTEGLLKSIPDIENVVVKKTASGAPILVKNVSDVRLGKAVRYGAMLKNGKEVAGAVVMMLKGENSKQVVAAVKERMQQIQKSLPEGMVVEPFLDRTKLVNDSIHTVSKNLIEGALIVVLVLVLMLGNFRAGFLVASVIPLAMLFAITMMNLFGVSGNLMSLGAIDFGLIVDGAVIIVESVLHYITSRGSYGNKIASNDMDEIVQYSSHKMMSSAAFGQIVILIVYLPLLTLVGIEGKMFRPMAQTVSFALVGALLLSLTYVPVMSSIFLKKNASSQFKISEQMVEWLQKVYQPAIAYVLKRKKQTILIAMGLFFSSLLIFMNLGGEFIPTLDEGDFACETRLMVGSSLQGTIDVSAKASDILLKKFPEVKQVVAKIGTSEIPTDPMPLEAADLMIILKPKTEWTSAGDREELAQKITDALSVIPNASFGVQQPISMRFNELMTGAKQDVVIKIYGENLDTLSHYSVLISEQMRSIKGVQDIYVEQMSGSPQIIVKIDRERAAQYGLSESDINETVQTAFAGGKAGTLYEGERRFDMVVRLNDQNRTGVEDVKQLLIPTNTGGTIPLHYVAQVSLTNSPNQIQRDNTQRRIIVGFNIREGDVQTIVEHIKSKIDKKIKLPAGYFISYGGQFQNLQKAKDRLAIAVPVALLLIFVLLFFAFSSIKQALLILSAIPLAAIGGVFALLVRGMPFSISAGVGFIALFGIAVLNGIVLIAQFNDLKDKGVEDIYQRIVEGTTTRLRPIFMTAMVASLGFLPMAISTSSGAEVQKPLATVVIGGLITATLLTLFVLPILYYWFERGKWRLRKTKTLAVVVVSFMLLSQADAQEVLTIKDAVKIGLENSREVKVSQMDVEYNKALLPTATDIGKTSFMYQNGQISSFKTDNSFQVAQSIPFPLVMVNHHKLLKQQVKTAQAQLELDKKMTVLKIKWAYEDWAYLYAQKSLLLKQDSIAQALLRVVSIRRDVGESGYFEKNNAEILLLNTKNSLEQVASEIQNAQNALFRLMAYSGENKIPETIEIKRINQFEVTMATVPELKLSNQYIESAKQSYRLEKNRFMPDITLGVFNQSINPTEGRLDYGRRYQVYELGLAIPIWFSPQKSRVAGAKIQLSKSIQQHDLQQDIVKTHIQQLKTTYLQAQNALLRFDKELLPKANQSVVFAHKAFTQGAIDYLQYLQAIKSSTDVYQQYLQTLQRNNQAVVQIEYYQNIE